MDKIILLKLCLDLTVRSDPTKNKGWKGYARGMSKKSVYRLNQKISRVNIIRV